MKPKSKKPTIGQPVWITEPVTRFGPGSPRLQLRSETITHVWRGHFSVSTGEVFTTPRWEDADDGRVRAYRTRVGAEREMETMNLKLTVRRAVDDGMTLPTLRAIHKLILEATS